MSTLNLEDRLWPWLRRLGWAGIAVGFIVPVVGEAASPAWDWTPFDFMFAYIVLLTAGLLVECFAAVVKEPKFRIGFGLVIVCIFFGIWAWAVA